VLSDDVEVVSQQQVEGEMDGAAERVLDGHCERRVMDGI
jgi:hypothetical protein